MRSLYFCILLICAGTLSVSLAAFIVVALSVGMGRTTNNLRFIAAHQFRFAAQQYAEGGPPAAAEFLTALDQAYGSRHYLVDAAGRDVLTGDDRNDVIAAARPLTWWRRLYYPFHGPTPPCCSRTPTLRSG